jgi:hypothetical protein
MSGDQGVGVPPPPVRLYVGAPSLESKLGRAFLLCDSTCYAPQIFIISSSLKTGERLLMIIKLLPC